MNLHENPQLFEEAIRFTADKIEMLEIYVEKDYWVTYVLFHLFNDEETKSMAVFKGGTSLSKCFKIINRFSEDIDITIIQDGTENSNQLNRKIRKITNKVKTILNEEELRGVTSKCGSIRKIAYSYPKSFNGEYGQIRDRIIVEASTFGHSIPNTSRLINSYIYDMMLANDQIELAEKYNLLPFEVNVLSPKRTICEKIIGLVKSCQADNPLDELKAKIRHCYDLHQVISMPEYKNFFNSDEFAEILLKVGRDDIESCPENEWLFTHPKEAIIYKDATTIWESLKPTYIGPFANLVIGELPPPDGVEATLITIYNRLNKIEWNLIGEIYA